MKDTKSFQKHFAKLRIHGKGKDCSGLWKDHLKPESSYSSCSFQDVDAQCDFLLKKYKPLTSLSAKTRSESYLLHFLSFPPTPAKPQQPTAAAAKQKTPKPTPPHKFPRKIISSQWRSNWSLVLQICPWLSMEPSTTQQLLRGYRKKSHLKCHITQK